MIDKQSCDRDKMCHSIILLSFVIFLACSVGNSNGIPLQEIVPQTATQEVTYNISDNNQTALDEIRPNQFENVSTQLTDHHSTDVTNKTTYVENDSTKDNNNVYVEIKNTTNNVEQEMQMNNDVHNANDRSLKILNIPDTDSENVASTLEENIRSSVKDEIQLEQNFETPAIDVIDDIPDPEVRQTLTEDLMAMEYPQSLKENNENIEQVIEVLTTHKEESHQTESSKPTAIPTINSSPASVPDIDFETTTTALATTEENYSTDSQDVQTTTFLPGDEIVNNNEDSQGKREAPFLRSQLRQMRGLSDESDTKDTSTETDSDSGDSTESESKDSSLSETSNSVDSSYRNEIDNSSSDNLLEEAKISFEELTPTTDKPLEIISEELDDMTPIHTTTEPATVQLEDSLVTVGEGSKTTSQAHLVNQDELPLTTTEDVISQQSVITKNELNKTETVIPLLSSSSPKQPEVPYNISEATISENSLFQESQIISTTSEQTNYISKNVESDLVTTEPVLFTNSSLGSTNAVRAVEATTKEFQLLDKSLYEANHSFVTESTWNAHKTNVLSQTMFDDHSSDMKLTDLNDIASEMPATVDANTKPFNHSVHHPNSISKKLSSNISTENSSIIIKMITNQTTPIVDTAQVDTTYLQMIDKTTQTPTESFAATKDHGPKSSPAANSIHMSTETQSILQKTQKPYVIDNYDHATPQSIDPATKVDDRTTEVPFHMKSMHSTTSKDESTVVADEVIAPADAGQFLNSIVAETLAKPLPTRSVDDEPSTSSYSSEDKTATVTVICLSVSILFIAFSVAMYLITFRRHHGTLDIEMQEQRCGKDDLNEDDEDAETRVTLLHQLPSVDSDDQILEQNNDKYFCALNKFLNEEN